MADDNELNRRIRPVPEPADEEEIEDLRARIAEKKRRRRTFLIAAAVILAAAFLVYYFIHRYRRYDSYAVSWQKDLSEGSLVGYEPFGSGFLKYSKDGVTYLTGRGEEEWVDTYAMRNPSASVSGDYAVIADRQGNDVRIYNTKGKTGEAASTLPLTKAAISASGIAAVVEEDADSSYIRFLNSDGSTIDITIRTILSGDGYPTSIALSDDGTRLMAGFACLNGGNLTGRVVFYDFSEIGKNIPTRLVGGFDEPYTDSLVAEVHYLSEPYSFAASTNGLTFFSSKNLASPTLIEQIDETEEIRSLFYDKDHVGIILNNTKSTEKYRLELYRADGSKEFEQTFDDTYLSASIDGRNIFLLSSNFAMIYDISGVLKFRGPLDFAVSSMRNGRLPGEFLMAGPSNIKGVHLR